MATQRERDRRNMRIADASRRVAEHSTGGRQTLKLPDGIRFFNPNRVGQAYPIDVVPYELTDASKKFVKNYAKVGEWYYERTYFQHEHIGVSNERYVCPAATFGKKCPICDHIRTLRASPNKEALKLADSLKPKERQLFLIYDREDERRGLQLWEVSFHLFGKSLQKKIANKAGTPQHKAYLNFFHPFEGLTVRMIPGEKPMPGGRPITEFDVDDMVKREHPIPDNIIDHGYNLDDFVREVSFDDLKRAFFGDVSDDDRGGDDDGTGGDEDPGDYRGGGGAWGRTMGPERDTDFGRAGRNGDGDDDGERRPRAESRGRDGDDGERRPSRGRDDDRDRDEAPPPRAAKASEFAAGDHVRWDSGRDGELEGEVIEIDDLRKIARIKVEGRERPATADLDELKPADPPTRQRRRDDDEPPPKSRARDEEPAPERPAAGGKSKRGWDTEDDDKPFDRDAPREKPAAKGGKPKDDEEPPKKKGGGRK